jgi:hypothetical protein
VFVAVGIQHAKCMRRIKLPPVACPAAQYFFHIISQTARFSGKVIGQKMCFDFLYHFRLKHAKNNSAKYDHKYELFFI